MGHRLRAYVALRKESVDRNYGRTLKEVQAKVALRKESVDRNDDAKKKAKEFGGSLSARRAWIEIFAAAALALARSGRSPQGERG